MSHKLLNRGGGGIGWELSVNRNVGWFGNRNLFLHEMALGVWYHSFPSPTPNLVYWCSFNIHTVYLSLGPAGVGILSEVTCLSMGFWLSLKDPAGLGFALQHFVCLPGRSYIVPHSPPCVIPCLQVGLGSSSSSCRGRTLWKVPFVPRPLSYHTHRHTGLRSYESSTWPHPQSPH